MSFPNFKSSIAGLLLLLLSITYANPMRPHTVEVGGIKGFKSTATVNLARMARTATSSRQDFQPFEIQSDLASTSRESAVQNDEHVGVNKQDESSAVRHPTEQPLLEVDPDMSAPFWDSTKIENDQQQQTQEDDAPILDRGESKPNRPQAEQPEGSPEDRIKEAERLQKAISIFHLNRVSVTPAPRPASRRASHVLAEPFEKQRALGGFPHLITNTLDNFRHQLDWSRFEAYF